METIQLYRDPDYYVNALLDGVVFFLRMTWNTEAYFWTMRIEDTDRNVLVSLKVLPNRRLLAAYSTPGLPAGELVVISTSKSISINDFADGYATLVYVSADEL